MRAHAGSRRCLAVSRRRGLLARLRPRTEPGGRAPAERRARVGWFPPGDWTPARARVKAWLPRKVGADWRSKWRGWALQQKPFRDWSETEGRGLEGAGRETCGVERSAEVVAAARPIEGAGVRVPPRPHPDLGTRRLGGVEGPCGVGVRHHPPSEDQEERAPRPSLSS